MLNKSIIMGRLTADPELKQTPNGVSVCSFYVAVDRNYVSEGQERQTDFIGVTSWRQTAEFVSKYFKKGKFIVVEGSIQTRSYDDTRYPEVKHYVTEICAERVYFGGDKEKSSSGNAAPPPAPPAKNTHSNTQVAAPAANTAAPQSDFGNLGDFEEIIGEGDLPF